MIDLSKELLEHHSVGKRYTYFPAISQWNDFDDKALDIYAHSPNRAKCAVYIHLPFCKSLCTFCGCNIKVSQKNEDHINYIDAIIKEFELKLAHTHAQHLLKDSKNPVTIIIGGGTPNALTDDAWDKFILFLKTRFSYISKDSLCELGPFAARSHRIAQLEELGIKRFSIGIQDFNKDILENVNRYQDNVTSFRDLLGDDSQLGIDLIWGLPLQTSEFIKKWYKPLEETRADWINFYPLAKVPWLSSIQQAYGHFELPELPTKYDLYCTGVRVFEKLNYLNYGMGHFIHAESPMAVSFRSKNLHRNLSGLFTHKINYTINLGVSSIATNDEHFWQNEKILERYLNRVLVKNELPIIKYFKKLDHSFSKVIDLVIEQHVIPGEFFEHLQLPKVWFSHDHGLAKNNETQYVPLSDLGLHFKKNILQTIEKSWLELSTIKI